MPRGAVRRRTSSINDERCLINDKLFHFFLNLGITKGAPLVVVASASASMAWQAVAAAEREARKLVSEAAVAANTKKATH